MYMEMYRTNRNLFMLKSITIILGFFLIPLYVGFSPQSKGEEIGNRQTEVVESKSFQLLDYEADVTISYTISRYRIFSSATCVFPLNPATIATDQGVFEEELKIGFYWTAGIRVKF